MTRRGHSQRVQVSPILLGPFAKQCDGLGELGPTGHTNWRLSNGISWISGQPKDAERKLDPVKIAGKALSKVALNGG